jgi:hypothetical protein
MVVLPLIWEFQETLMSRKISVPSYKLHKPSGRARVILDGEHFYLGPFGSEESHEEYARLIARRTIQPSAVPRDPIDRQIENVSVSELIVRYWAYAETYYRKSDGSPTSKLQCLCSGPASFCRGPRARGRLLWEDAAFP